VGGAGGWQENKRQEARDKRQETRDKQDKGKRIVEKGEKVPREWLKWFLVCGQVLLRIVL